MKSETNIKCKPYNIKGTVTEDFCIGRRIKANYIRDVKCKDFITVKLTASLSTPCRHIGGLDVYLHLFLTRSLCDVSG